MWRDIPVWFRIGFVIFLILGIATAAFTFEKCGAKALLLGNGGFAAAAMGMCD